MGGAQNSLLHLLRKLDRKKFNPYVICPSTGIFSDKLNHSGVDVEKIRLVPCSKTRQSQSQSLINKVKVIILRLLSLIKVMLYVYKHKIDIIHTNVHYYSIESGLSAKIFNIPHILHVRLDLGDPNTQFIFHKKRMLKIFDWYSDKIIAISKAVKNTYLEINNTNKIEVIYNGVDLELFNKKKQYKNESVIDMGLKNKKIVAMISIIQHRKRHKDFIKAISMVRENYHHVRFLIVGKVAGGSENYYEELSAMVYKMELNNIVTFLDFQRDVQNIFKDISILVHPAIHEAFGRVLIEAMAFEKPVIAVDSGALPEIVVDCETGLIIKSKDPKLLSEAIITLLKDPDKCKKMGIAGRKRVEKYFNDRIYVDRIEQAYKKLLLT